MSERVVGPIFRKEEWQSKKVCRQVYQLGFTPHIESVE